MEAHAELIIAPSIEAAPIPEELKKESIDTVHFVRLKIGIDDSRELYRLSSQKAWEGQRRFVIFTEGITGEAQNALLKLFEEPPERCVFFLILPNSSGLLPTLRSRLIEKASQNHGETSEETKQFLKMTPGERMEVIADRAKKAPESLERLVTEIGQLDLKDVEAKRSMLLTLTYIKNRGASRKMLTEEIALSV